MASTTCEPKKIIRTYHMSANLVRDSNNYVDYFQIFIMLTYSTTMSIVCTEATTADENHTNLNNQVTQAQAQV